jgi:hypothetical protein
LDEAAVARRPGSSESQRTDDEQARSMRSIILHYSIYPTVSQVLMVST